MLQFTYALLRHKGCKSYVVTLRDHVMLGRYHYVVIESSRVASNSACECAICAPVRFDRFMKCLLWTIGVGVFFWSGTFWVGPLQKKDLASIQQCFLSRPSMQRGEYHTLKPSAAVDDRLPPIELVSGRPQREFMMSSVVLKFAAGADGSIDTAAWSA